MQKVLVLSGSVRSAYESRVVGDDIIIEVVGDPKSVGVLELRREKFCIRRMIGLEKPLFLKEITLQNVCLGNVGKIRAGTILRCQAIQKRLASRTIEVDFQKGIFFLERIDDLSSVRYIYGSVPTYGAFFLRPLENRLRRAALSGAFARTVPNRPAQHD